MIPIAPQKPFYLFGFGPRRKLVYQDGSVRDAVTGAVLRRWDVRSQHIEPADHRVRFESTNGQVTIYEDEDGVWLRGPAGAAPELLTGSRVHLPRFDGHPHAALLRALHADILVNVMPFGPVPNLWVYPRPWYRDSAMMLMVLQRTGNLHLVEPWVTGLHKVYDRNNSGIGEADNLGQVLFMVSLVSDRKHPLVDRVLAEIPKFRKGDHIVGQSDYAEHPVYQTKWLKFGLRALGLDDPFNVPLVPDKYSSLFWMDYRDQHVPGPRFGADELRLYPYLNWAEAHFLDAPPPAPASLAYPLSWEINASEAEYWRMRIVDDWLARERVGTPHTWHAAEMFLYFHSRA